MNEIWRAYLNKSWRTFIFIRVNRSDRASKRFDIKKQKQQQSKLCMRHGAHCSMDAWRDYCCVHIFFEQIELPAKLLDCFLWSNKSNINQYWQSLLFHYNQWFRCFITINDSAMRLLCINQSMRDVTNVLYTFEWSGAVTASLSLGPSGAAGSWECILKITLIKRSKKY